MFKRMGSDFGASESLQKSVCDYCTGNRGGKYVISGSKNWLNAIGFILADRLVNRL